MKLSNIRKAFKFKNVRFPFDKRFMILWFDGCHGYYIQDHEGHTLTHGYDVETTLFHLNRFCPKYVIEKGFVHGEHFVINGDKWSLVEKEKSL